MIDDDGPGAGARKGDQVIVLPDNEPLQPSIFCNKSRPADEQTPGRKDAGATSKKPSDPLFQALRTMCMRQAPPTPLQPFTDVSQLQEFMKEPSLILHHDHWLRPDRVGLLAASASARPIVVDHNHLLVLGGSTPQISETTTLSMA